MFESIDNVFQRHTLSNKLRARRDFYVVKMKSVEKNAVLHKQSSAAQNNFEANEC